MGAHIAYGSARCGALPMQACHAGHQQADYMDAPHRVERTIVRGKCLPMSFYASAGTPMPSMAMATTAATAASESMQPHTCAAGRKESFRGSVT